MPPAANRKDTATKIPHYVIALFLHSQQEQIPAAVQRRIPVPGYGPRARDLVDIDGLARLGPSDDELDTHSPAQGPPMPVVIAGRTIGDPVNELMAFDYADEDVCGATIQLVQGHEGIVELEVRRTGR
jgi:hypothetical protein